MINVPVGATRVGAEQTDEADVTTESLVGVGSVVRMIFVEMLGIVALGQVFRNTFLVRLECSFTGQPALSVKLERLDRDGGVFHIPAVKVDLTSCEASCGCGGVSQDVIFECPGSWWRGSTAGESIVYKSGKSRATGSQVVARQTT